MAKIHDKYIIELAEVIKGYGNDPDVKDPFRLSEFYRFYELPEIAVSRQHFEKMQPLQQTDVPLEFTVYDAESGDPIPTSDESFFLFDQDGKLVFAQADDCGYWLDEIKKEGRYIVQFGNGTYLRW